VSIGMTNDYYFCYYYTFDRLFKRFKSVAGLHEQGRVSHSYFTATQGTCE
jgi:hypothetical protein